MIGRNFNWRLPDTLEEITSAPLICYCGVIPDTPEMRVAVRTAIHTLARARNWETKDGILAKDVALFMFQLEQGFHVDCCDLMQGCMTDIIRPLLDKQSQDLLQELEDKYDTDGVPGIAPNLVYDMTADDLGRDLVVCYMCRALVNLVLDAEIQRRQEQRELTYWQLNFLSDLAVIIAPFLAPLGAAIALGAAIGLKIASVAGPLGQLADEVLNDDVARDLVSCCMTEGLRGQTPSYSRFQQSLDGCGFGVLQNAEYIRQIMYPLIQDLDVYLAFLATGDDIWPYVEMGLLDICPCDTVVCANEDFAVDDGGFAAITWLGGTASYVTATAWKSAHLTESPQHYGLWCEKDFDAPVAVTGVTVHYTCTHTRDNESRQVNFYLDDELVQTLPLGNPSGYREVTIETTIVADKVAVVIADKGASSADDCILQYIEVCAANTAVWS